MGNSAKKLGREGMTTTNEESVTMSIAAFGELIGRAEKAESQVRDLTRPIDGTFVLSAEPTKEEISQARQVIGQLQREVRDLTGEREGLITERDELANELRMLDYNHRALEAKHSGLRDNVERLERALKDAKLAYGRLFTENVALEGKIDGLEAELAGEDI